LEWDSKKVLCAEAKGRKEKLSRLGRADGCVFIHPKDPKNKQNFTPRITKFKQSGYTSTCNEIQQHLSVKVP
jgi:hypothetical protein